jgi:TonB family protein
VEFDIGPDGRVANAEIVAAVPTDLFEDATVRAMRHWRYEPARCAGETITRRDAATFFNFMMRGSEDDPGRGWRLDPN